MSEEILERLEELSKRVEEIAERLGALRAEDELEDAVAELEHVLGGPVDRAAARELGPDALRTTAEILRALGIGNRPRVRGPRLEAWAAEHPLRFGVLVAALTGFVLWVVLRWAGA